MRARIARTGAIAATMFGGLLVLLLSCSAWQVRRAREARAGLDDLLYTEEEGAGEPVIVFLPGVLGTTRYWQSAGFEAARLHARLLFVDPLGFGRSPWPDIDYTLDDHVAALRRTLVSRRATDHATIVAHSFGAIVAAEYAARFRTDVDRLYLFGAPIYRSEDEARERIADLRWVTGRLAARRLAAWLICAVHNAFAPAAAQVARRLRPDLPPEVAADATLHFWRSLNGTVNNVILRAPIEPSLARLRGKVTFIHGRADRVTALARVAEVARLDGDQLITTGDSHGSYWRTAAAILTPRLARKGSEDLCHKQLLNQWSERRASVSVSTWPSARFSPPRSSL